MGTVTVLDTDVEIIEYRGERVTTFAAVDKLHQRPEGTASRTFNNNAERFDTPTDYVRVSRAEVRAFFPGLIGDRGGGDVVLLTRRGYLKITKPLSDDRAWKVQGVMIDRYFAAESEAPSLSGGIPTAATTFRAVHGIAILIGCDANQSALSANKATLKVTGVNLLELMGRTHLDAPQQARLLTPTDLGQELDPPRSAIKANSLLRDRGFQEPARDAKGRAAWDLTEKGKPYGVIQDTGKRNSDGTPVRQLKWSADILVHLREAA